MTSAPPETERCIRRPGVRGAGACGLVAGAGISPPVRSWPSEIPYVASIVMRRVEYLACTPITL
jgi:hypothetical protein